jgi:hypothetical protein
MNTLTHAIPLVAHITTITARGARPRMSCAIVVLAALASASISARAQGFVDADIARHRCAVLGDIHSCRQPEPRPEVWCEEWVELGTYAKYLHHLGADPEEAIAKARLKGEEPMRHVAQVSRLTLTPEQSYARGMGLRIVPDVQTRSISVTPAREANPPLQSSWFAGQLSSTTTKCSR